MSQLLDFAVVGIATGTTYAIVGLGICLVYQVTGVINFAQGDFVMVGGLTFAVAEESGLAALPAAALAVVATTVVGGLVQLGVIAPARRATHDRLVILTIGASITLQGAALLAFGADQHFARPFGGEDHVALFGARISSQYLWCAAVTGLVMVGMWLVLRHTGLGRAMRATALDVETVRLMGVSPQRMSLLAFVLAAALAAIGGIVLSPLQPPDATIGVALGLKGFTAAVLGGLGSPAGAVVGGLAVGLVEAGVTGYVSSGYRDPIVFGILVLVLLVRPTGLLRRGAVVRV
ncbi:branched-chain amino acid ABC transporter permease [Micromonospora sp. NPDC005367]|uniref:branched-chain amino acid ABC transporter permease n=1 Tax=Micromonospora sp. NPDC005367 TaxID=3155590 RepID=UPI0033BE6118